MLGKLKPARRDSVVEWDGRDRDLRVGVYFCPWFTGKGVEANLKVEVGNKEVDDVGYHPLERGMGIDRKRGSAPRHA